MSNCRFIIICILTLILIPAEAISLNGETETVRVGIFPFQPINFVDKNGTAQGIFPDLLREIFKDESARLAFVYGSWAEGLARLQNEEIDLMISVAYSKERAKIMDYGKESVLQLWGQVFTRKEENSSNISDLFGKRVGVMKEDISARNFEKTLAQFGGSCELVEYSSHGDVFRAVQSGEVLAGVAPQHFGLRHASEYGLVGTSILFSPFSIYFTTKKGLHHELLDNIDSHLSHWKKEPKSFYFQTLNRWMSPTVTKTVVPLWIWISAFVVLVAIIISMSFVVLLNRAVNRKTRELAESENRFRDVALNVSDWIWEVDTAGRYTYCSEHVKKLLGYTPEEMIGRSFLDFVPEGVTDEYRSSFSQRMLAKVSFRNLEQVILRKDGSIVNILVSAAPIWNRQGELTGFRGVDTDITERKQAEREKRKLEEKLAQAQKMEAVGTLAGGIAHDFNNILAASLGYTELALDDLNKDSNAAEFLRESMKAGLRARDLVRQILAFSRQSEVAVIALSPHSIVKEAIKMLRSSLPATITISQDIHPAEETILFNPSQFHQIVMNLCTNAYHAMEKDGGTLRIALRKKQLAGEDLDREQNIEPGWFYQLSVADTGYGIPEDIRDKIFDPYFTTKEQEKGTGMGLAIVHGLVRDNGGFISCYSQEGEGTVFHVFLPCHSSNAVEQDINVKQKELPTGSENILLVDDEDMIVSMGKVILERLGYDVFGLSDSHEALQVFKNNPEEFDLVITDQTMPGLTGLELSRQMLEVRPDLPIILCSGYSSTVNAEMAKSVGIRCFINKPLVKSEVAQKIREVLDTGSDKKC